MMAVDHYPVALRLSDLIAAGGAILLTSLLIAATGAYLGRPQRQKN